MKKLANKAKKIAKMYAARKKKVNKKIKNQVFDLRILVHKSLNYISAQVLDINGNVIATVTDKWAAGETKVLRAEAAGKALAEKIAKTDAKVVFDRNGHLYHGRVKAFAEWIRAWGINI